LAGEGWAVPSELSTVRGVEREFDEERPAGEMRRGRRSDGEDHLDAVAVVIAEMPRRLQAMGLWAPEL
jgi:hypothetical protein